MFDGDIEGMIDVSILCIGLLYRDLRIHITCSANQQMHQCFLAYAAIRQRAHMLYWLASRRLDL